MKEVSLVGHLSLLLGNIMFNELDRELERSVGKFVQYYNDLVLCVIANEVPK